MMWVLAISWKPSDAKNAGVRVSTITSAGENARTRSITAWTRRRPMPRRRYGARTATLWISTEAFSGSPISGQIW